MAEGNSHETRNLHSKPGASHSLVRFYFLRPGVRKDGNRSPAQLLPACFFPNTLSYRERIGPGRKGGSRGTDSVYDFEGRVAETPVSANRPGHVPDGYQF